MSKISKVGKRNDINDGYVRSTFYDIWLRCKVYDLEVTYVQE